MTKSERARSSTQIKPTQALLVAGKNESEEKRELIFKEDGQGEGRLRSARRAQERPKLLCVCGFS